MVYDTWRLAFPSEATCGKGLWQHASMQLEVSMRNLLTVAGIVILLGVAGAVQATEDGTKPSDQPPGPGGQYSPADGALVEAWNDNGAAGSTSTYISPCFAFQYTPSTSYVLEKIEW